MTKDEKYKLIKILNDNGFNTRPQYFDGLEFASIYDFSSFEIKVANGEWLKLDYDYDLINILDLNMHHFLDAQKNTQKVIDLFKSSGIFQNPNNKNND